MSRNNLIILLSLAALFCFTLLVSTILGLSLLYPIATTAFIGSFILLWEKPLWLLFGLIIVRMSLDYFGETISLNISDTVSLTLSQLIGMGVFVLGGLFLTRHIRNIGSLSGALPLVLILIWGFFSLLVSIDPANTARELLRIFDILALFGLAYFSVRTQLDFKRLLQAIFLSSLLPLAVAVFQFFSGIGFQDEAVDIPRIYSTFSHPNILSLYLFSLIVLSGLYFFLFAQTARAKIFTVSLASLYAVILLMTYSRVAWVALFLFLLILSVLRFRAWLMPLILIPLLLYIFVLPLQERINDSFDPSPDSSIVWRQNLWKDTIKITFANERTLLGHGMNTFSGVSESLRGIYFGSNDPHNDFVKFFVEGGFFGLAIFCFSIAWINLTLFKRSLRPTHSSFLTNHYSLITNHSQTVFLFLFAFFFALTAASLTDNIFKNTPVQWIFWITLGASLAIFGKEKGRVVSHRH